MLPSRHFIRLHLYKDQIVTGARTMALMKTILANLSWPLVILACVALGLAPFVPEPHIVEKLRMLASGTLVRPIDIFDLLMHGAPFAVAGAKLALSGHPGHKPD